jgi:hypothetical protein
VKDPQPSGWGICEIAAAALVGWTEASPTSRLGFSHGLCVGGIEERRSAKRQSATLGRRERNSKEPGKRRGDVTHIYLTEIAARCDSWTRDEER